MIVECFESKKHLPMIRQWFYDRGYLNPFPEDLLPKFGFVCKDVAAVFLYRTDSSMGLIENMITNPLSSKSERAEGILAVMKALEKKAKQLKIKILLGFTHNASFQQKIEDLGFVPTERDLTMYLKGEM